MGEWTHGWQYHASVARDTLFATRVHLPPLSTDHEALRASQRGPCASRHFTSLPTSFPTSSETTFTAEEFRTHRFRKCGARLDVFGHHRSACSPVGLLKPRGTRAEICVARICREAGKPGVWVLRGAAGTAKPSTRLRTTSAADSTSWLTGAGVSFS